MRRMTDEELGTAPKFGKWASICTVTQDNCPYAIEASYFIDDLGHVYFMTNIAANPGQRCPMLVVVPKKRCSRPQFTKQMWTT